MADKSEVLAALRAYSKHHGKEGALRLIKRVTGKSALADVPPEHYAAIIAAADAENMRTVLREFAALSSDEAAKELVRAVSGKTWIADSDKTAIAKVTAAANAPNVSVFATERRLRMARRSAARVAS